MSIYDILAKPAAIPVMKKLEDSPTLWEVAGQARQDIRYNSQINSRYIAEEKAREQRNAKYTELTGEPMPKFRAYDDEERYIKALRKLDERFNDVATEFELPEKAAEYAALVGQESAEVYRDAGTGAAIGGTLLGGLAASVQDPVTLAATAVSFAIAPFTGGAAVAPTLGRTVLKSAIREAAINASIEAAISPFIANWQREVGNDFGISDIISNIAFQAVAGGVLGGASTALTYKGARRAEIRRSLMDDKRLDERLRGMKSWQFEAMATAPISDDAKMIAKSIAARDYVIEQTIFPKGRSGAEMARHLDNYQSVARAMLLDDPTLAKIDDAGAVIPVGGLTPYEALPDAIKNITAETHKALSKGIATDLRTLKDMVNELGGLKPTKSVVEYTANWKKKSKSALTQDGEVNIDHAITRAVEEGFFFKKPTRKQFMEAWENNRLQEYSQDDTIAAAVAEYKDRNTSLERLRSDFKEAGIDYKKPYSGLKKDIEKIRSESGFSAEQALRDAEPAGAATVAGNVTISAGSNDFVQSLATDFKALAKERPDIELHLDGEKTTLAALAEDIEAEQEIIDLFTVCGLG